MYISTGDEKIVDTLPLVLSKRRASARVRCLIVAMRWWKNNEETTRSNESSAYGMENDKPSSKWMSSFSCRDFLRASFRISGSPSSP
jgi:hypothetical protein